MHTHILDASTLNQMQIAVCAIHSSGCVRVFFVCIFLFTFISTVFGDSVCVCVCLLLVFVVKSPVHFEYKLKLMFTQNLSSIRISIEKDSLHLFSLHSSVSSNEVLKFNSFSILVFLTPSFFFPHITFFNAPL